MEQPGSNLKSGALGDYPSELVYSPARPNPNLEKRVRDQILFDEALLVGGDWLEASGGQPLTQRQYTDLYEGGFVSHGADEVLEIFGDWEIYQQDSVVFHNDRVKERNEKEQRLLETIKQECDLNLAPKILLKEVISYSVRYCEVNPESGERGKIIRLQRYEVIDNPASPEIIIQRYSRYQLADYLLRDRPGEDDVPEDRKTSIAMGFSIDTGKPLSSFFGAIKNSHAFITESEVERASEELGVYDYIHKNARGNHLKKLRAAIKPLDPEYYYDPELKRVIILGRTAIRQFSDAEGKVFLEHLKNNRQLVIGKAAIKALAKDLAGENRIQRLDELLSADVHELKPAGRDYYKFREWSNDDYISYGSWLLGISAQDHNQLRTKEIRVASRIGLGPGEKGITSHFHGIDNFFKEIGFANRSRNNAFADWSFEDHVENIKRIAAETGVRPTRSLLMKRIKKGYREPSPNVITATHGFTAVLKAAGFEQYHKAKNKENCLDSGIRFYVQNGRIPSKRDFGGNTILGSYAPIYKLFGNMPNYQKALEEYIGAKLDESTKAA